MKRWRWIAAIVCAASVAAADPKTPDEWFDYGQNQYNLGNFDKAIEAFKKGFELEPSENKKAAYLFNIAQAYRQAQNCKEAQFFYKRYLAFKDADTKKPLSAADRQVIELVELGLVPWLVWRTHGDTSLRSWGRRRPSG